MEYDRGRDRASRNRGADRAASRRIADRLDLAFGPDNTAVYVQVGSAWARP